VYILAIFPPLEGGEKNRHFSKFGEENRPSAEKKFWEDKKTQILYINIFSITTETLESNT
jgi:hypothetical protein